MDIIPTSLSFFEGFVIKSIRQAKLDTLESLEKALELFDDSLAATRASHYRLIRFGERDILTSIGMLHLRRRYYQDIVSQERTFLLDAKLGIPKRSRIMCDVRIRLIEAASEMSYLKAGRYASDAGYPVSKATVCRLVRDADYYIEDSDALLANDSHIHVQIDEKFVRVIGEGGASQSKKTFTATIFKGIMAKGNRRVLLNRSLLSGNDLQALFRKINDRLSRKYRVTPDTLIFVSGDLASYIQHAPEKISVCKARYVPDKYHIKHAIRSSLGFAASDGQINDPRYQAMLVDSLEEIKTADAQKVRSLLKNNPESLLAYLDPDYDGCSQECMNSHYYCPRFGKVPNIFRHKTVQTLAKIIDARENGSRVRMGFREEFYEPPVEIELGGEICERMRYDINTEAMGVASKRMFRDIEYGIFK